MATAAWAARFGKPSWPRNMAATTYPFLAALDDMLLDCVTLHDLAGAPVVVRVEKCQTPYKSFLLLWVPPRRRLRQPRKVRIIHSDEVQPGTTSPD